MSFRGAYEWLMGVEPALQGLQISPCIPGDWEHTSVLFSCRNKRICLSIRRGTPGLLLNGKRIPQSIDEQRTYRPFYFLPWEDLKEQNQIDIYL